VTAHLPPRPGLLAVRVPEGFCFLPLGSPRFWYSEIVKHGGENVYCCYLPPNLAATLLSTNAAIAALNPPFADLMMW
jgi:hypothetical protein